MDKLIVKDNKQVRILFIFTIPSSVCVCTVIKGWKYERRPSNSTVVGEDVLLLLDTILLKRGCLLLLDMVWKYCTEKLYHCRLTRC